MAKKKKILLMSDDLRMHSGIATQSKEFVMGTLHQYDWVQIGAAIKHPDAGKRIDMNEAVRSETGVSDAQLTIYPSDGYGNPDMLRKIISLENPDVILHFTDPRFWIWFYQMEHEIRQTIPIMYYNIWDDLPTPLYNKNYYKSCDVLMAISKQTYGINKRILTDYEDWQINYVPHGINHTKFFKIETGDTKLINFKKKFDLDKFKFKVLYLNRNIRRKNPGDVALAFKHFTELIGKDKAKECCLIFHTQPSDENGTDLRAVCKTLLPDCNVIFTHEKQNLFNDEEMNFIYNTADVYINLASNEGFGLGSAEALMSETPIVVNVTGGLQDQCGFKTEKTHISGAGSSLEYLTAEDYVELGSNHTREHQVHGEWAKPVFPTNLSLQGSPLTPYIFDDRASYEDAGKALKYWYDKSSEEIQVCGKKGREFLLNTDIGMSAETMSNNFIDVIEETFKKWKPKDKYTLEVV